MHILKNSPNKNTTLCYKSNLQNDIHEDLIRLFIIFCFLSTVISLYGCSSYKKDNSRGEYAEFKQSVTEPVQASIAHYRFGKKAAVSFTFDDGDISHIKLAAPLLEEFGWRGTFFILPGKIHDTSSSIQSSWTSWKAISAKGHEIGNHSMTHPALDKIAGEDSLKREILDSAQIIKDKIGVAPVTFAYPYGAYNKRVDNFVYSAHVIGRDVRFLYGGEAFTLQKANNWIDEALNGKGADWVVPLLHELGENKGYSTDINLFRENLLYIKTLESKIWVDTYGNVARYIRERNRANLSVVRNTKNKFMFTLTLPVDMSSEVYNVPLTVVIPVPSSASGILKVKRGNTSSAFALTALKDTLLVNVVPGKVPVTVLWKSK